MLSTHQDQLHPETAHHKMFSASSLDRCTTGLLIYDGTTLRAAGNRTVLITVYTTALEA